MANSGSKFHFEGEAFKDNKGQIQIGETIYNQGGTQFTINQTEILNHIQQLRKKIDTAKDLDPPIRRQLLDIADSTEAEVQREFPDGSKLSRFNQRLQALLPGLTLWQTITSTVSTICDLLPKG
ncbi:hypothetical protein [Laceyella putida]|uniref:Uncharacterized protein n=1 Tax=Laceyella putida TaxID=110101 RepID=A0ABW2RF31_9BACL